MGAVFTANMASVPSRRSPVWSGAVDERSSANEHATTRSHREFIPRARCQETLDEVLKPVLLIPMH